jgi:hypothetical protein
MTFPETYDFVSVSAFQTQGSGSIKYNLLCATDNSILCGGFDANGIVDLKTNAKDTYKLEIYDECIYDTCTATPPTITGFAITGVSRSPI